MPTSVNIGTFILEDDIEMHDVLRETLKENGYNKNYQITHDPKMFLENLNSDINICVIDHLLNASITGLDIIREVKNKNKWSWVIVMTGQASKKIVEKYQNAGANRYIDKNWSEEELREILNGCPKKNLHPTYLDVMVKFLKEAFEEAKERVAIVKALENMKLT